MVRKIEILNTAIAERNDALTFASLTLDNLRLIEGIYRQNQTGLRVHFVTHIVNSLLGLVVFTCEKEFTRHTLKEKMVDLINKGWPTWSFTLGNSIDLTLGEFAYHLRNGAAHARLKYSSDSPNPSEVVITIEDAYPKTKQVYWRVSITAADLLTFCYMYGQHLEEIIL